jgi:SAM-dependent methyltransferase
MPKPLPSKPNLTDWAGVADWYDKLVGGGGSEYHREVVLPGVTRLLRPEPTLRVLDLACGQGVLARHLAVRGCVVTGVESAGSLLDAARRHDAALPPEAARPVYVRGDARELSHPPGSFDAAACVLAIQNIQPIAPVFAGVAAALRPGGRFVIVMMHPCFRGPKESSWGWDDNTRQFRRVDRYLLPRKHPIVAHPGVDASAYTWTFHRPIGEYVKQLAKAGLLVDAMEEWPSHKTSEAGPRAAAENTARKEIPMFLAVRSVKVG